MRKPLRKWPYRSFPMHVFGHLSNITPILDTFRLCILIELFQHRFYSSNVIITLVCKNRCLYAYILVVSDIMQSLDLWSVWINMITPTYQYQHWLHSLPRNQFSIPLTEEQNLMRVVRFWCIWLTSACVVMMHKHMINSAMCAHPRLFWHGTQCCIFHSCSSPYCCCMINSTRLRSNNTPWLMISVIRAHVESY